MHQDAPTLVSGSTVVIMNEPDLNGVQQAWREATNVDVAEAVVNPEGIPLEVMEVILWEKQRRGLTDEDIAALTVRERPLIVVAIGRVLALLQRWPRISAGVVGAAMPFVVRLLTSGTVGVSSRYAALLVPVIYLAALAAICYPWRRYKNVLTVTLVAAFCWTVADAGMVPATSRALHTSWFFVCVAVVRCIVVWAVSFGLLCGVVFIRNRYWPVYPPGHCTNCGYNLRGLETPRCPECGQPFDEDTSPSARPDIRY